MRTCIFLSNLPRERSGTRQDRLFPLIVVEFVLEVRHN